MTHLTFLLLALLALVLTAYGLPLAFQIVLAPLIGWAIGRDVQGWNKDRDG